MWDPVGVLGEGGGRILIPGLKPGAEMLHPFRVQRVLGDGT